VWSSTILDLARLAVMGIMRGSKGMRSGAVVLPVWVPVVDPGILNGRGGGAYKVHLNNTKSIVQDGVKIMPFRYCERYEWGMSCFLMIRCRSTYIENNIIFNLEINPTSINLQNFHHPNFSFSTTMGI
jgi:hypothetical protein